MHRIPAYIGKLVCLAALVGCGDSLNEPGPENEGAGGGGATCSQSQANALGCDRVAPLLSFTRPLDGARVTGTVSVAGMASDNFELDRVEVRVGQGPFARADGLATWSATVDLSGATGSQHLEARATDKAGNQTSAFVTVTVSASSGGPVDAGTTPGQDAGPTPGQDAGTTPTVDAGTPLGVDTSCGSGAQLKVPSQHATVGAALAAARDGDTIFVEPGSYAVGTLTLDKKRLTLTSAYCNTKNPADVEAVRLTGKIVFAAGQADDGRLLGVTVLEPGGKDTVQPQARGTKILFNRIIAANDVIALDAQVGPVLIHGNYIKSNGGDDNIDIDGKFDVTIENNVLDTAAQDGIEMRFHSGITQLQTVTIRGNLFLNPAEDGVQFMDGYGVDPKLRRVLIERNVFVKAGTAGVGMNHQSDSNQTYLGEPIQEEIVVLNNTFLDCGAGISGGANVLAANNIFKGSKTRALWKVGGASKVDKNLFFQNVKDHESSNVVAADNLFGVDPLLNSDGALGAGSPAIDAGKASFVWGTKTIAVTPGYQRGSAPDLGGRERP